MKPFDLSQYMLTLSQAAGAGNVGYNSGNTYSAGTVGAALKALAPTTLTQGSVVFAGAGGALSQDNASLFFDDTNNRLGIGQAVPQSKLHVEQTTDGEIARFQRGGGTNIPILKINFSEANNTAGFETTGATGAHMSFVTGAAERMRIASNGFVGINTTPPASGSSGFFVGTEMSLNTVGANNVLYFNGHWDGTFKSLTTGYEAHITHNKDIGDLVFWSSSASAAAGAAVPTVERFKITPNGTLHMLNNVQFYGELGMPNTTSSITVSPSPTFGGNGGGGLVLRGQTSAYQPGWVEFYAGTGAGKSERAAFLNTGELAIYGQANQLLLKNSKAGNEHTLIQRTDTSNFYFLLSDPATYPNGTWNVLRPFTINLSNGNVSCSTKIGVYGAGTVELRNSGDILTHRGNNTGYLFFGNAEGRYVGFDGGNYIMPFSDLYVNGSLVSTAANVTTFSNVKRFWSGGGIIWGNPYTHCQGYNNDGGGAGFAMLREAQYGIHWMLDPDNIVRLGGWSSGVRFTSDTAGNFVATGNVAIYSDERLKTNWRPVRPDFVQQLAAIGYSGIFDRIDTKETQVGVGAQSIQRFFPEAVRMGDNNTLTLNYGSAAMVSAVELAKKVVELEEKVARLERLIRQ